MLAQHGEVVERCGQHEARSCRGRIDSQPWDGVQRAHARARDGRGVVERRDGAEGDGRGAHVGAGVVLHAPADGDGGEGQVRAGEAGGGEGWCGRYRTAGEPRWAVCCQVGG